MKFEVGDRVKCVAVYGGNAMPVGKNGTIIATARGGVGVEFDEHIMGHDSSYYGACGKLGHCWNFHENPEKYLERIAGDRKILITSDGTTTTARMYEGKKVVKSASAKCSPDDTFDFKTGADLAYNRLMCAEKPVAKPEPPKDPVKLYYVEDCPCGCAKKGKVYETIDGFVYGENGQREKLSTYRKGTLVPLVKRPAKVGERVYVTEQEGQYTHPAGTVGKVTSLGEGYPSWVRLNGLPHSLIRDDQYLVLDGWKGPEE